PGGDGAPGPRPARAVPVPWSARRPAGGDAVRRGAVPGHAGEPAAGGARAAVAAAGRADQQPGHGQRAPVVGGAAVLSGRAARRRPRRAVPPRTRPHPLAAPGWGPSGDRPALTMPRIPTRMAPAMGVLVEPWFPDSRRSAGGIDRHPGGGAVGRRPSSSEPNSPAAPGA